MRTSSPLQSLDAAAKQQLEFITLPNGDLVHGTGMNYEIVDGVLHFYVNYNLTLIKPTENTPMETLAVDVGTKEG